jgi:hypothetical protein
MTGPATASPASSNKNTTKSILHQSKSKATSSTYSILTCSTRKKLPSTTWKHSKTLITWWSSLRLVLLTRTWLLRFSGKSGTLLKSLGLKPSSPRAFCSFTSTSKSPSTEFDIFAFHHSLLILLNDYSLFLFF